LSYSIYLHTKIIFDQTREKVNFIYHSHFNLINSTEINAPTAFLWIYLKLKETMLDHVLANLHITHSVTQNLC